jgi:AAA15 family ATPase/GTPase
LELSDLGQFNLITGRNNVGKSNVLEAVYLPLALNHETYFGSLLSIRSFPPDDFIWKNLFNRFDITKKISIKYGYKTEKHNDSIVNVDAFSELSEQEFKASFMSIKELSKSNQEYGTQDFMRQWFLKSLDETSPATNESNVVGLKITVSDTSSDLIELAKFVIKLKEPITIQEKNAVVNLGLNGQIYSDFTPVSYVSLPLAENDIIEEFEDTDRKKRLPFIVEVLNSFHSEFKVTTITANRKGLYVDSENVSEKFPLCVNGMGYRSAFNILVIIASNSNGILLLDELDNGLHYTAQKNILKAMMRLAKQLNVQIFATTHSMECVRAFSEVANEGDGFDARLINLHKFPDTNQHEADIYGKDEMAYLLKAGMELRQ